jgi:hypothetical protein
VLQPPAGPGSWADPCARTTSPTSSSSTRRYGVRQRGSSLDARAHRRRDTQRARLRSRGTAVYLTCGAEAALDEVVLDDNDAAGLEVSGAGTAVVVTELQVTRTEVHPTFLDACSFGRGVGAVQVHDGARLSVSLFTISNNQGYGLLASFDGQATRADGIIMNTRDVVCANGRTALGFNAATLEGGTADVTHFTFTRPDIAGAVLYENGEMDLRNGEVSRGAIGVSLQWAFDARRLEPGVRYFDNDTTLDGAALPVPEEVGSLE